jgi:small nuclear ribonucleoprotein D2
MESDEDKKNKEKTEEDMINEGPLSLLKDAVRTNSQILIYCRNNRKLLGRIRAFDRHMNIILEAVCEIWSEMMKGKSKQHKLRNRERFISKMFLRGDSIILIVKNPNETRSDAEKKKDKKDKKKEVDEKDKRDGNKGIELDEEKDKDKDKEKDKEKDKYSDEDEKEKNDNKKEKKKRNYEEKNENSSEENTEKEIRNRKRKRE